MKNQLLGFGGGETVEPAAVNYEGSADDAVARTVYTYTSQPIGTPAANRYVVVCIGSNSNARTVTSVTVAGQPCTIIQTAATANRTGGMAVTNAPVTAGATATVVVTLSGGDSGCAISTYSLNTSAGSVADSFISTTADSSDTLNIPIKGVAVASIRSSENVGDSSITAGVTQDSDIWVDSSVGSLLTGSDEFPAGDASRTVSWETGGGQTVAIGAAWGP